MTEKDSTNQGTVSVVVPTYNDDEYLKRSIKSIINQKYDEIEIIIVDSGDSSIALSVAGNYSNIKYIGTPPNGPAAARNVGINEATGEYISFLDADDEWFPEKTSKQIDALNNSGKEFVFSEYLKENGTRERVRGIDFPDSEPPHEYYFRKGEGIGSRTVLVPSEYLDDNKFDENLKAREDPHLWVRILRECDPIKVQEPLAIKHIRSDSLTGDSELVWKNEKREINSLADKYEELDKYRDMRLRMADYRFAKNLLNDGSNRRAREILKRMYKDQDSHDIRIVALFLTSMIPFGHNYVISTLEWVYDTQNKFLNRYI